MSILTRPLGKPKKPKDAAPAASAASAEPSREVVTTRTKAGPAPALAISPRASLMPPELGERRKKVAMRRNLRIMVVAALVVAIGGSGAGFYYSTSAQQQLAAAQAETQSLSTQQQSHNDIKATLSGIDTGRAAVKVGGSTDIDWQDYITQLQGKLPSGVTLSDFAVQTSGVTITFPQSTTPLEGPRIATLNFSATTSQLPSIPTWIEGLSSLPGFVDATPGTLSQDSGVYTASVTMHIDADAYSHRFAPKEDDK
jgi:hypothetical protein